MRLFTGADLSKEYFRPATWAKRPPPSSSWLVPFSSAATTSLPVICERRQRVLEGQHGQHLAHGDHALVDGGAQAAAVLEHDLHALAFDAIEDRVRHQIAHLAFAGAAIVAAAVDRLGRLGDFLGFQRFDRRAELLDAGKHGSVGRHRLVEIDRVAGRFLDDAVVVEDYFDLAQIFRIGRRLHHRHLVAVRVVDHRRVRAFGLRIGLRQQRVGMAADHHVNAGDLGDDVPFARDSRYG